MAYDSVERRLAKEHPLSSLLGDTSELVRSWFPKVTGWLTTAINEILNFGFTALISLALSLMIVWEIPRLKAGLERVRGTRAEWILDEIAPEVVRLGTVIGVAFTAQFVIASIDASLAFVALTYLKLPSPVFLSLLVLVACLVPYVGVLIAALPILIVALQQGGVSLGLNTAFWLFMIHELEAWILSPKIMSGFLKLSPMMVVLVLCVAEPLFGLWGLILGVPVAVFLINDVLLKPLPGNRSGSGPEAGGSPVLG
jgi:predicted PurR-regulated permease PerM